MMIFKNRINNHVMIGEKTFSWEVACKILLEDNIRVHRVQPYKKTTSKQDKNKRWKQNMVFSRYGECTHDRNAEENVHMIRMKKTVVGLDNVNVWGYHPCTTSDAIQT